jgi:hypothetical protein
MQELGPIPPGHCTPGAHLCIGEEILAGFDNRGVFLPVKNYKCVINTGNAPPIAVKKIQYGSKELPIMRRAISALKKVEHICQIHNRRWLFNTILAPKPHQEHINCIDNFI